jgi:predicted AAA+ superfamily ATPase
MQKNLSESLLGRYETIPMTHWSFEEMRDCFDFTLDQYIYFGGYPGPARLAHTDEVRWRNLVKSSLIEPNLVKDVMALANIERPAVLRQLFELGCSYSGQIVAVNKLLQYLDDAGSSNTASHYLNLLKASGLLASLAKYTHDTTRQRASIRKLNVLTTTFLSIYSGYTFEQAKQDRTFWGRLVESCIGAHLLNSAQGITQISYWNESSMEVDFVVHQGNRVAALEVKSSTPKAGAHKGLTAFTNKHAQLNPKTHIVGGDDIALVEALCKPAESWL